jgi:hypothetical protein
MDFNSIQHLGEVRQQEILEQAERDRMGVPLPAAWRERLGLALIALGRRLASAASLSDAGETSAVSINHLRGGL